MEPALLRDLTLAILARPSYHEATQSLARTLAKYHAPMRFQDLVSKIPVHTSTGI